MKTKEGKMMLGAVHNMIDAFCPITGLSVDAWGVITIHFKDTALPAQRVQAQKLLDDIQSGKTAVEATPLKLEERVALMEKDIGEIKKKLGGG